MAKIHFGVTIPQIRNLGEAKQNALESKEGYDSLWCATTLWPQSPQIPILERGR